LSTRLVIADGQFHHLHRSTANCLGTTHPFWRRGRLSAPFITPQMLSAVITPAGVCHPVVWLLPPSISTHTDAVEAPGWND